MVDVAERAGHLEVAGVARRDLERALALLPLVQELQSEAVAGDRDELVRALMRHRVPLRPPASVMQAQRLAAHRDALLATDVFTHESVAALRGDRKISTTRTWVTRNRSQRKIFTVTHDGRMLLPAFQLTPAGQPRPELAPLLGVLLDAGVDGWELWTWLTSRTGLLSGEVPHELAAHDGARALRAAERSVSKAAMPASV
jgi:hypothetical protein